MISGHNSLPKIKKHLKNQQRTSKNRQQPEEPVYNQTINLISIKQQTMTLHKHTLSLDLNRHTNQLTHYPQISDVIKNTIDQQIHQHVTIVPHPPQHSLIVKTRQLLRYSYAKDKYSTITDKLPQKSNSQSKRGSTSSTRCRRQNKLNQVKKQLQLLNEMYQKLGKDQIKRYQEQIEHQESEIQATITHYNLKRNWQTSTTKSYKVRSAKEQALKLEKKESPKRETTGDSNDPDSFLYRFHPYQRLLLNRRKSKGRVSPWTTSQPQQLN